MSHDIDIARTALPPGYREGAHHHGSCWYIIRESDGASIVAQYRPDYEEPVTAQELDDAIASPRG